MRLVIKLEITIKYCSGQPLLSKELQMHHPSLSIWVRSLNWGCLVTWFCYHLIAKPGNKTAPVPWPDPYSDPIMPIILLSCDCLKDCYESVVPYIGTCDCCASMMHYMHTSDKGGGLLNQFSHFTLCFLVSSNYQKDVSYQVSSSYLTGVAVAYP